LKPSAPTCEVHRGLVSWPPVTLSIRTAWLKRLLVRSTEDAATVIPCGVADVAHPCKAALTIIINDTAAAPAVPRIDAIGNREVMSSSLTYLLASAAAAAGGVAAAAVTDGGAAVVDGANRPTASPSLCNITVICVG
jgi:hypothetical protein